MKIRSLCLSLAVAASGAMFAAIAFAAEESCALEIKRLDSRNSSSPSDYLYRSTSSQYLNAQIGPKGKSNIRFGGAEENEAAFKKIVKKEPKYESDHPFRGIAKFGTQEYAFALDESTPDSEKKAEADGKDAKAKTEGEVPSTPAVKSDSAITELANSLIQAFAPSSPPVPGKSIKGLGLNRLYFDLNHNGDLTDDKVIEADKMPGMVINNGSYQRFEFPRVDITLDMDGTPVEYAFFVSGYVNTSTEYSYAGVQINSAAYREGDINLDGKKRHVVLIDYNSNGRFEDEFKIANNAVGQNGQLYPQQGDMLLVDPGQTSPGFTSPYEASGNSYQHYVSKMVDIDGKYYDMKITPAGDKLTLTPSDVKLGSITNPNNSFNAVIYSDKVLLKINGTKDTPIAVPEGEWKVLSYTINMAKIPEPSKPAEKKAEADKNSGVQALGKALEKMLSTSAVSPSGIMPRFSFVSAQGTAKYKPVKVTEGETVVLAFGPPYKPVVNVDYIQQGGIGSKQARLGMSLVGSAGELVTNMMVNGSRPGKPEFTIKDPKGEVVQSGSFEYG